MSAFVMLATAPRTPTPPSRNRSLSVQSPRQPIRPRQSLLGGRSISMAASTISGNKPKRIFDPKVMQYVDVEDLMSPFEQQIHIYEEKVKDFAKSDRYGDLTELLNSSLRSEPDSQGKHSRLLAIEELEHMRFCYFEEFEPDLAAVQNRLSSYSPQYKEMVSYNEKLARYSDTQQRNTKHRNTSMLRPIDVFVLSISGIRNVLQQPLLWNDVYLDIKMESASHYDCLPNRVVAQKLVGDLADISLSHVHFISCHIDGSSDLSADELFELKKQQFFYFGIRGYADLAALKKEVYNDFIVHMHHLYMEVRKDDILKLLEVLIRCVCDNLLIQYYGRRGAELILDHFREYMTVVADIMLRTPADAERMRDDVGSQEDSLKDVTLKNRSPRSSKGHTGSSPASLPLSSMLMSAAASVKSLKSSLDQPWHSLKVQEKSLKRTKKFFSTFGSKMIPKRQER